MIRSRYPICSFDKVFTKVDRIIELDDIQEYNCVGVRQYGNGAFVRETKLGSHIRRKKQWRLCAGDVLYNKLFAWKGTFCIADDDLDGCIASDKFPTYTLNEEVAVPEYVRFWFQTDDLAREAKHLSRGAAALSKLTLNPPDFWRMPIPLPDTDEQERVVARLTSLLTKVQAITDARAPINAVLQGRRAGVGSSLRLVMSAGLRELSDGYASALGVLDDVLTMRPRSGPSFPCDEDGQGIEVVMPSALGGFRLDETKCLRGDGTESMSDKDLLKRGDLLIARGNKRDQVGLCVVYESDATRSYANLLMRLQVDTQKTLPAFAKYWMMTPLARDHVQRHTKGTSPSVQKINQKNLIQTPFPTGVALTKQAEWVSFLDCMFDGAERLEATAREQSELATVARAAILAAGFGGRL